MIGTLNPVIENPNKLGEIHGKGSEHTFPRDEPNGKHVHKCKGHNQTAWIPRWQRCKCAAGMQRYVLIQRGAFLFGVNVPQLLIADDILAAVLVIKSLELLYILAKVVRHCEGACRI